MSFDHWNSGFRRWAIVIGLLLLSLAAGREVLLNRPLITKARKIQLGQSEADVRAILGLPNMWQSRPVTLSTQRSWYGPVQAHWDWQIAYPINAKLPSWWTRYKLVECSNRDYPVEIQFDLDQRVTHLRIGRTVIAK